MGSSCVLTGWSPSVCALQLKTTLGFIQDTLYDLHVQENPEKLYSIMCFGLFDLSHLRDYLCASLVCVNANDTQSMKLIAKPFIIMNCYLKDSDDTGSYINWWIRMMLY